jgi:acyl-CoA reductase-like NAD-dependent aldehyde dehydrogenase
MKYHLLLNGKLVDGASTMGVVNPATGRVFADCPRADSAQLDLAVDAAQAAFPAWEALGYAGRRVRLEAFADAIAERTDALTRILTMEQGKPLRHAREEVERALSTLRYYAAQSLEMEVLREDANSRIIEHRTALGVVAAITPWNFPLMLLMLKIGPALITGNSVIAKPAPTTPLTTMIIGEAAAETLPPGVFQTLADENDLGSALTTHPSVRHVSFTGSTATGKKVLASVADTLKRFQLELGGNDAAIVLDDADVASVAAHLFANTTYNCGQICVATKRIYAPDALYDELCDALADHANKAVVGDGLEEGSTMGPVQNRQQYEKLLDLLDEANAKGTVLSGGKPMAGEGYFIPPTIVRDIPDDTKLVREEQFGPIVPVLRYSDIEDAIARANDSEYGLAGSVWTSDVERGVAVACRIDTGTVWVNREISLPLDIPFGGAKLSGIGRQQGIEGLQEFTQAKVVQIALD